MRLGKNSLIILMHTLIAVFYCTCKFLNPVNQSLLFCTGPYKQRKQLWNWTNDTVSVPLAVHSASLTELDVLLNILGKTSETLCESPELRKLFLQE